MMNLKQTRIVTNDVPALTSFYEKLTGATATVLNAGYAEFQRNPCAGLAIATSAVAKAYGEGVVSVAANRSLIIDFEVDDVDAEYDRLQGIVSDWVQPPTVQPWGNRTILFRDPDGNLINMYMQPRAAE